MQKACDPAPLLIRSGQPSDASGLSALVRAAAVFSPEEITCADEIILDALNKPSPAGYQILVAVLAEQPDLIIGYVCFGQTPFTLGAWDLYWLATHPGHRRLGAASALVAEMERALCAQGGTHVRVETSGTGGYSAARAFYDRAGYQNVARILDFYKPGDALYTFVKHL